MFSIYTPMKYLPLLLLLFFAPPISSQAQWIHVETTQYDWNRDGQLYTFILDIPKGWNRGGDYSRLRIFAPNGRCFTFEDNGGLATLADSLSPNWVNPHLTDLLKKNPVKSRYLLFLPVNSNPEKPLLLFMVGWAYGSSPGSLHVVALDKGIPRQILYQEEFQFEDYADLNGDGFPEIVGAPCFSQEWDGDLLTYDPYWVYSLPSSGTGRAQLSIPLSKKYNLEHYYGWAGPNCSEKLAVVLHPPGGGKPLIMNASKAEKLTEGIRNPRK